MFFLRVVIGLLHVLLAVSVTKLYIWSAFGVSPVIRKKAYLRYFILTLQRSFKQIKNKDSKQLLDNRY